MKTILTVLIPAFLAFGGLFGYWNYQANTLDQAELAFVTDNSWSWHQKDQRIQIAYSDAAEKSILRRVYLDENYAIYATKGDDYSPEVTAQFVSACQPGKQMVTSQTFPDGEPKILVCDEAGEAVYFSRRFPEAGSAFVWDESLDGFSFREEFDAWDFSKLDQEVTLKKAQ
ncbi:MAG: hypothetical protein ACR2P6_04840 [Gammaproteobacteria bacterium]